MAESTSIPTPSASPPRDMMLRVVPVRYMRKKVVTTEIGMEMPMMSVVRAALPFLAVLFVFLILVTYVPWISTFLPTYFMGPELITN